MFINVLNQSYSFYFHPHHYGLEAWIPLSVGTKKLPGAKPELAGRLLAPPPSALLYFLINSGGFLCLLLGVSSSPIVEDPPIFSDFYYFGILTW